jgi:cytochrome c oxidase assembly protein subunit 15
MRSGGILTFGFGTTVAMWTCAYLCRIPPAVVPSHVLLPAMLVCMLCGGFLAGRYTNLGWRGGLYVGVLTSILNVLILGSLLGGGRPNQVVPSALLWLPGSILASAALGATGARIASRRKRCQESFPRQFWEASQTPQLVRGKIPDTFFAINWTFAFSCVATFAAMLLLTAGGLVTSKEAGLTVVDWPNSFGYNMFLYPLSRMSGGIYYEHAHRLLGSLVGLTVLVLTAHLWRSDSRRWLRLFALLIAAMTVCQGILGGLRVTGHLTLSTSREAMAPSINLAVLHGVLGQVVFALLVAMSVFTSTRWMICPDHQRAPSGATDRALTRLLPALLLLQLIAGAMLRHTYRGLHIHITMAVIVAIVALACGLRAYALQGHSIIRRTGLFLLSATAAQILLGVSALIATGALTFVKPPRPVEVIIATSHQAFGAIVLACAVMLALWCHRLVLPAPNAHR